LFSIPEPKARGISRKFSKHCRIDDPQAIILSVDRRKAVSLRVLLFVTWRGLKNKNQLDATYYFIVLLIGSTCFGHYYAHHAIACSPDTTPAYPHLTSNLQKPKNETTVVVINFIVASS